jgi:uncharacterized protein YjbI with pentapeptide repeats
MVSSQHSQYVIALYSHSLSSSHISSFTDNQLVYFCRMICKLKYFSSFLVIRSDFRGCDLSGLNMSRSKFTGCSFTATNMSNTDFTEADLSKKFPFFSIADFSVKCSSSFSFLKFLSLKDETFCFLDNDRSGCS